MANKLVAAHAALEQVLRQTFPDLPDAQFVRNQGGHKEPPQRTSGVLVPWFSLDDDQDPEVLGVLNGPTYDLEAKPTVILAYRGGTRQSRLDQAYADLELVRLALAADPTLGGAVDYAEIASAPEADADTANWLAGGLEVGLSILLTAPTRAG